MLEIVRFLAGQGFRLLSNGTLAGEFTVAGGWGVPKRELKPATTAGLTFFAAAVLTSFRREIIRATFVERRLPRIEALERILLQSPSSRARISSTSVGASRIRRVLRTAMNISGYKSCHVANWKRYNMYRNAGAYAVLTIEKWYKNRGLKMRVFSSVLGMGIAAMLLVSGCAVQKTMEATGGSRSDGTVKLSYEFGMFQVPNVDMAQGTAAALRRCASWGYTGAEPFGGQTKTCNGYGSGSCNSWLVTVEFQCTGTPVASK